MQFDCSLTVHIKVLFYSYSLIAIHQFDFFLLFDKVRWQFEDKWYFVTALYSLIEGLQSAAVFKSLMMRCITAVCLIFIPTYGWCCMQFDD